MHKGTISYIKNDLLKDTLYTQVGKISEKTKKDFLVLSSVERSFINDQLDKMSEKIWKDGLLDNSEMLSMDKIGNIVGNSQLGWLDYYKQYKSGFFTFSKPIFVRDNNICIFYYSYSWGSLCGQDELAIFKNEDGKWVKWLILSHTTS